MANRSNSYHLTHHEENPPSWVSLSSKEEGVAGLFRALTEKSTSSLEDTGHRKIGGNISSLTGRFWWP
jgi:hypothetical protein